MRKRLWEVPECLAACAQLLGVESQVVSVSEHLLENEACFFDSARACESLNQPEGTHVERAFPSWQIVQSAGALDDLPGGEGTFNMCTFWLVEALTRAGRVEEARLIFEKMLGYANHLGLYAEQLGASGQALGNFPQAFTHMALISSAFNLNKTLGD